MSVTRATSTAPREAARWDAANEGTATQARMPLGAGAGDAGLDQEPAHALPAGAGQHAEVVEHARRRRRRPGSARRRGDRRRPPRGRRTTACRGAAVNTARAAGGTSSARPCTAAQSRRSRAERTSRAWVPGGPGGAPGPAPRGPARPRAGSTGRGSRGPPAGSAGRRRRGGPRRFNVHGASLVDITARQVSSSRSLSGPAKPPGVVAQHAVGPRGRATAVRPTGARPVSWTRRRAAGG